MTAETPTHETRIMFGASPVSSSFGALGISIFSWMDYTDSNWVGFVAILVWFLAMQGMNIPQKGKHLLTGIGLATVIGIGSAGAGFAVHALALPTSLQGSVPGVLICQAIAFMLAYRLLRKLMPVLPHQAQTS
ncbi:hypothetical protein ACN082_00995 [Rothia sp. CCM 9417]|uniref:hypothetical protein n=1 Tax=Rothia sp. CCM 9417 TaxID=3402657 RepID=UPI003AE0AB76